MKLRLSPGAGTVLAVILGTVFLAVIYLNRTTGIHVDENNYTKYIKDTPLGDARESGKPPLFYMFNHGAYRAMTWLRFPRNPAVVHFLYIFLTGAAAVLFARCVAENRRTFWTVFFLLTSSFLLVFNATQLMMETAVLPAVVAAAGFLLKGKADERPRAREQILLLLLIAWAVSIKYTAVPAVLAMTPLFRHRRFQTLALIGGILLGILCNGLLASAVPDRMPQPGYGGLSFLFDPEHLFRKVQVIPTYAWNWIFFVSPVLLGLSLISVWIGKSAFTSDLSGFILLGSSFAMTLVLAFAAGVDFVRYAFPVMLVGVVACTFIMRNAPFWMLALVFAWNGMLIAELVKSRDSMDYPLFPERFRNEAFHNTGTNFSGFKIHLWNAETMLTGKASCISLAADTEHTVRKGLIAPYLYAFWRQGDPLFIDGRRFGDLEKCHGRKIYFQRNHADHPDVDETYAFCRGHNALKCTRQELVVWVEPGRGALGPAMNCVCILD